MSLRAASAGPVTTCHPTFPRSLGTSPSYATRQRAALVPGLVLWATWCHGLRVTRVPRGGRDAWRMLEWLEGLGAKGLEKISVKSGDKGLGVFALEDLPEGEVVCSVPGQAILTADPMPPTGTPEAALAAELLKERNKGSASFFETYISLLPAELPYSHPLLWPHGVDAERLLAGSVHGKEVAEDLLSAGARNLALLMSQGFTEAESRWALVIVDTRAFTFQSGTEQECLALVPLLDLFNNRTTSQLWQCSFEPDGPVEDGALLLAERSIGAKEDETWENLFESAGLEVKLMISPPLAREKEAAVQEFLKDKVSTRILELPQDAEAGGEMMPLARLLASETLEELHRAVASVKYAARRVPERQDLILELKARRLVRSWLQEALAASKAAAEDGLEAPNSELKELRRCARRLLDLERPVLQLELDATQRFLSEGALAVEDETFHRFVEANWQEDSGWMGAG